ncbi:P-loop containing nucleoside triphosphate hydrolase protein [Coemansia mojavensis]|nr:P-loop containing nucleoside triphosphate hydrolase protein [Coemansia mojavensis]
MFSWKEFSLKPISLKIDQGMFVTVVGKVGSGKSSFLSALCGEMPLTSGTGAINGSIGYVSQKPWIMNATIKDNILFGNKYEQARYIRIIHACALTEDLEQLPHKDMTEIGRQGINLSGGQKARLALARAIYNDADIYILDDILAAVDAQVEKHIIDNVLLGIIKDNTRILVTHSKHVVPLSDINIVVDNGNLSVSQAMAVFEKKETLAEPDADIITDEEVEKYNYNPPLVPYSTFTLMRMFIKLSGYGLVALVMLMQLTRIGGQMYLMNMKMRLLSSADVNISRYLISDLIFDILLQELEKQVEIVQETYWFRKVNKEMKRILIESLMQAKLTVVERLSKSRLVKLFNWDVLEIAAFGARQFTAKTYGVIQSCAFIVSAIYSSPEILVIIMAVHLSFALLARLVGNTSSESVEYDYDGDLKDEILNGHEIIRVHNKVDVFLAKLTQIQINDILNEYNRQISSIFANAAYLVKKTIITLVVLLQIPYYSQNGNFIEHIVNLTDGIYENFSNIINGDGSLQGFEDSARSYFTFTGTLDKENCDVSQSKPPNWPQQGIVEFKNYSLQYRPDLPLVLQNLSFTTKPGEKIGIVGRTGAGKSSLTFALLRLVEAAQGSIYIDGIDISTIGLHDLRSSIAMVPQDPMILPGTIRDNLDPGNEYNDAAIQLALEKTGIWPLLDDQLDTWVDGTRFSAGQRQLLSLSRALLWNRKIVILDEATANIDSHTDQLIQQLIRQEFAHSTVLTIAHRLNTVMDSDRILVMNQGHVVEFDTPQALLQQPGSLFKQMVDSMNYNKQELDSA